jgi:ribosome-associated protein
MTSTPALRSAARRAAALPAPALLAECQEEFFNAGGPGGQHRNKTESGVRLTHPPTGLTVTATERRSQVQNRGAALVRLRERLAALGVEPKPRRAVRLPEAALQAECEETFFIASGPGGQHRNKTESGVRLLHRPSGVLVTATERRSQVQNRGEALKRLRAKLAELGVEPKRRRPTKPTRGSQERRIAEKKHRAAQRAERKRID